MHVVGSCEPVRGSPCTRWISVCDRVAERAGRAKFLWPGLGEAASWPTDSSFQSLCTRGAGQSLATSQLSQHRLGSRSKLMLLVRQV